MNGLLYPQPEGVLMDPRSQMIMQTGLGLLAAGGPSRTPAGLGQAFGQAGMQGLQAYQQANQANQQQQLFQMKMAEAQRAEEERRRQEAAFAELSKDPRLAGIPPQLLKAAPQQAMSMLMPKKPENPFTRLNPADYTPESLRAFQTTNDVSTLVPRQDQAKAPQTRQVRIGNEQVTQEFVGGQWQEVGRGPAFSDKPLVAVDTRQENEFSKAVGKEMGEQYAGLLKTDMNAPATIAKYQRLGQLLGSVNTGKFKGTTTELKAAAKSLGVDLGAMGITDDVAPAQASKALSNMLALENRNPSGGAGMPGALSDKDREFLVQTIPSLENDPAAIGTMIDYRVRLEKRSQQVARMARAYRRKNDGKFDEGFYDELAEWSEKNPLFPEAANAPKPAPTPAPSSGGWSIRPK